MSDTDGPVKRSGGPKELIHDPRRLKRCRLIAGMKLTDAAANAGCDKSHLSKLEHGVYGGSPHLLATLAGLYERPVTDLMPPRYRDLVARFARETDPDGSLPAVKRDACALKLLADYLKHGEPETNGKAA